MSNRDLICTCKNHYLEGSTRCMVDMCGLNGRRCILAETETIYATPETQEWFGNFRCKEVPVHHDCPEWQKETLAPYESSCQKYAADGIASRWSK